MTGRSTKYLVALATAAAALAVSATSTGTATAAGRTSAGGAAVTSDAVVVCRNAHFDDCVVGGVWVKDPLKNLDQGARFQDSISSITNGSGQRLCFWEHNDFQGRYLRLDSGQQIADLGGNVLNDAISSWKAC
ncbi:peptidase inhibitor family I36 protein [Kitasatospora sp. NPDC058201]|uniref:peptidase inhibitor family I36 protein n=1 Tax=unclassified Kitasatospora TaxID=2633591 RepID=UPI003649545F